MESRLNPRLAFLVLIFALVVYSANFFAFNRATAPTYDEGVHIAAGYRILQCGNYAINPEHPPLAKALAAIPIRNQPIAPLAENCEAGGFNKEQSVSVGEQILSGPGGDGIVHAARRPLLVFPLLLIVVIFFSVREWFGPLAACIAVLLVAFEPVLTACGALVTTDMPITAAMFTAMACTYFFLQRPGTLTTSLLGLSFALALTTKHSGIIVPVMSLCALLLARAITRANVSYRTLFVGWSIAGAIAYVLLWASYGFRFYAAPALHQQAFQIPYRPLLIFALQHHLFPESYLTGFADVLNNSTGLFLLGHFFPTGVWFYYPVAMSIKTTLPLLLLVIAALFFSRELWNRNRQALIIIWVPVISYLAIASTSRYNVGVRHALPVYPFLIALASGAAVTLMRKWRTGTILVACLLLWQATAFMASRTSLLAYANEAYGGPSHLYEHMLVDWGQAAYHVTDWSNRNPQTPCILIWYAPTFPATHCTFTDNTSSGRLELEPPFVPQNFRGTVLISDAAYHDPELPYILKTFPMKPSGLLDGSVLVFSGDFDLSPIAANQHRLRAMLSLIHI